MLTGQRNLPMFKITKSRKNISRRLNLNYWLRSLIIGSVFEKLLKKQNSKFRSNALKKKHYSLLSSVFYALFVEKRQRNAKFFHNYRFLTHKATEILILLERTLK